MVQLLFDVVHQLEQMSFKFERKLGRHNCSLTQFGGWPNSLLYNGWCWYCDQSELLLWVGCEIRSKPQILIHCPPSTLRIPYRRAVEFRVEWKDSEWLLIKWLRLYYHWKHWLPVNLRKKFAFDWQPDIQIGSESSHGRNVEAWWRHDDCDWHVHRGRCRYSDHLLVDCSLSLTHFVKVQGE